MKNDSSIVSIINSIFKSWKSENIKSKAIILFSIFCGLTSLILSTIKQYSLSFNFEPILQLLTIFCIIPLFLLHLYQLYEEKLNESIRIDNIEEKVRNNPKEVKAAWALAQAKLESYLDRNLSQVKSIYWLIILLFILGFCIICYGVYKVYENPTTFKPTIVAAVSGILLNFIAASLMVIYKSLVIQASEYIKILERINAVGMSIQILENLREEFGNLKDKTLAEISKDILAFYKISN